MGFQVSPGVNVTEIDLTTIIPAVATTTGAFAGQFQWGPVEQATLVSSEDNLVSLFGKPNTNTQVDFFTVANFLAYTNACRVVRVVDADTGANNATVTKGNALLIKNDEHAENITETGTFYAKYPGALGNQLAIELCDNSANYASWYVNSFFSAAPDVSEWVSNRGGANDEVHIAVIDAAVATEGFSETANLVLEIYPFVSKASDAMDLSGDSNYFKTVINNRSNYIRVGEPAADTGTNYGKVSSEQSDAVGGGVGILSTRLSGGADGGTATGGIDAADYVAGYDLFADADKIDVALVLTGQGGNCDGADTDRNTVINHVIDNIAIKRKDCVAFFSPHKSDTVEKSNDAARLSAIVDPAGFRSQDTNKNTSYAFLDSGWKYQYDKYNDKYIWVPLNGDMGGLTARTEHQRDAWWSPAGYNRGQIKNVVRLAYNPSKAHRDDLYRAGVNPVVSFPGQGTLLFGDKTQQTKPSAFDRLNVRRLFIVLEKAISTAAKFSLFEFNDEFTRAQFRNMVEPFLRDIKGRRGITDFKVVCDDTNNPGSVIDRNEFVGDIYIKPARSINFIQLNFVAVATGVDFSEVVGKF